MLDGCTLSHDLKCSERAVLAMAVGGGRGLPVRMRFGISDPKPRLVEEPFLIDHSVNESPVFGNPSNDRPPYATVAGGSRGGPGSVVHAP